MTPSELLTGAITAAKIGGAVLLERLEQVRTVSFKGPGRSNLVTDADRASEDAILRHITTAFPGHAFLAEEGGGAGHSDWTWIIDPLDGTTNYAHGVPHFCVTLGVEGPGPNGPEVLAGVVYDPTRDEVFAAAKGQGATLNGKPIHVSNTSKLENALLCTGFPYDVQVKPEVPLGLFSKLVVQAQGIRRMGSAALDLAYVACGRYDGYFEFGLQPWDIAAGALLISEAGGAVSRIDGEPFDVRYGDILAASSALSPVLKQTTTAFLRDLKWKPRRFGGSQF